MDTLTSPRVVENIYWNKNKIFITQRSLFNFLLSLEEPVYLSPQFILSQVMLLASFMSKAGLTETSTLV